MKYKLINKAAEINKIIKYNFIVLGLFFLPGLAFGQPPPPTGNGGIPDNPLSVSFDAHLSILLIAAGIALAIVVITKIKKNYIPNAIQ